MPGSVADLQYMLAHLRDSSTAELEQETSRVQADASSRGMLGWGGLPLQYIEAAKRIWEKLIDSAIADVRQFHRASAIPLEELAPILRSDLTEALSRLRAVSKLDPAPAGRYPFNESAQELYEQAWAKLPAYLELKLRRFELGMDDVREDQQPSVIYSITANTISGPIQQGASHSAQTVVVSGDTLLNRLEATISSEVVDTDTQRELIDLVKQMQRQQGSAEFLNLYQRFMAAAANHMTVLAPFLPALAQMISG